MEACTCHMGTSYNRPVCFEETQKVLGAAKNVYE